MNRRNKIFPVEQLGKPTRTQIEGWNRRDDLKREAEINRGEIERQHIEREQLNREIDNLHRERDRIRRRYYWR